ncbi:DUF6928 family protein [Crossiella sp. NPDC003009]
MGSKAADPGVVCTASLPGLDVVCSRALAKPRPSQLTDDVVGLADGRSAYAVFMHSAEDWAAFALWAGGGRISCGRGDRL